jgi:outer membrane protein assembly factor BamB
MVVNGVSVDANDDIVITGGMLGTYDVGGVQLSGDSSAMFVAKYTTNGELMRAHRLESTINQAGESVVVGATGMIFATGNGLLAAYTPAGTLAWAHEFQGPTIQNQYNLGIVPDGSLVLVGTLYGPASLGGGIVEPSLAQQAFVAKYTQDGAFVASALVQAGSYQDSAEARVAIDPSGTIVVTDIESDAGPDTCVDAVHALDGELKEQWSSQAHSDCTIFRTLATGPSGAILRSTWNNDALYGQDEALRVSAYTRTGSVDETTFGHRLRVAPQISGVEGSAIGGRDTVAFTGHFGGSIDFGSGPLVTSGTNDLDAFIVALSAHAGP